MEKSAIFAHETQRPPVYEFYCEWDQNVHYKNHYGINFLGSRQRDHPSTLKVRHLLLLALVTGSCWYQCQDDKDHSFQAWRVSIKKYHWRRAPSTAIREILLTIRLETMLLDMLAVSVNVASLIMSDLSWSSTNLQNGAPPPCLLFPLGQGQGWSKILTFGKLIFFFLHLGQSLVHFLEQQGRFQPLQVNTYQPESLLLSFCSHAQHIQHTKLAQFTKSNKEYNTIQLALMLQSKMSKCTNVSRRDYAMLQFIMLLSWNSFSASTNGSRSSEVTLQEEDEEGEEERFETPNLELPVIVERKGTRERTSVNKIEEEEEEEVSPGRWECNNAPKIESKVKNGEL